MLHDKHICTTMHNLTFREQLTITNCIHGLRSGRSEGTTSMKYMSTSTWVTSPPYDTNREIQEHNARYTRLTNINI